MLHVRHDDQGSALVPICLILTLVALISLALANAGARLIDQAKAQTAADAAALAGASGGITNARRLATSNGATLIDVHENGARFQVTVQVRGARASATAALVVA